jgi:hypothetical protein
MTKHLLLLEIEEDAFTGVFFLPRIEGETRETRKGNGIVSRLNGHLFSRTGDITHTRA